MKKLNDVIRAITCCKVNEDDPCSGNCPYDGEEKCVGKVMADALEHLKEYKAEKAEREDPKPLTIEELWQMNGEPVYLDGFEWRVSYGVSTINGSLCLATGFDSWIPLDGYGESWFAYRHKPKEATAKN